MSQMKKSTGNAAEPRSRRTQDTNGARRPGKIKGSTSGRRFLEREDSSPEKARSAGRPATTNDRSSDRNARPSDRNDRSADRNDRSADRNGRQSDRNERPSDRSERSSDRNRDSRNSDNDRSRNTAPRSGRHNSTQRPQMKHTPKQFDRNRSSNDTFEVKTPEIPLEPMELTDLSPELQDACAKAGWTALMPVQAHTLPYILEKQDMMVQSRTGSGKTGAYLIPAFTQIDPERRECQALIIVPTRELAIQVEQEARTLFSSTPVKIVAVYGGVGYAKQLDALQRGAQIVVGTPGRVLDHLLKRNLILDNLRMLVFDEADRMLSIGFYPDMKEIQRYLPKKSLLVNLFSATYPPRVLQLASEFLNNPQMLSLSQGQVHVATSQHFYCESSSMDKDRILVRLLETENPASAIIFCNTKANVHYVTSVLRGFGYNADELSADLSQARREHVLKRLRNGDIRYLVATDVAARGIDIPELSHVFLYEPPDDRESYIHRAGRTGRAGATGTVISLVDIMEKLEVERIAKHYKMDILPMKAPTDSEIAKVSGERMVTLLETKRRLATGLELERAKRFLPLVKEMIQNADETEQLMLLALILDGDYQKSLSNTPKDISQQKSCPEPELKRPSKPSNRHGSQNRRQHR